MSDGKLVNRIPFEDIQDASAWSLPSLDDGAAVVPSVKKKPSQKNTDSVEKIEDVSAEEVAPITAQQLQQLTQEAEEEARQYGYQEGLKQGHAEGFAKGTKEGQQQAYNETKSILEEKSNLFADLANGLLDPVAMQDDELENWILDTAVQLAKHLISRELTEDPSALFHIVEKAVTSLPAGAKNIRIYLHPDDVELAHEAFTDSGNQWTFYADAGLSRGGCRVVSDQSLVDYTIESRLTNMLEAIQFEGEVDSEPQDTIASYRPPEQAEQLQNNWDGNTDNTFTPNAPNAPNAPNDSNQNNYVAPPYQEPEAPPSQQGWDSNEQQPNNPPPYNPQNDQGW